MFRKKVSRAMLLLLIISVVTLAFNIQPAVTGSATETSLGKVLVFEEGFEEGISVWWNDIKGTPTLSTEIVHSGSYSYVIDEDCDGLIHWFDPNIVAEKWEFEAWFYDSMHGLPTTSIIGTGWAPGEVLGALIWYGGDYEYFYAYRYGFVLPPTLSTHPRSIGWHKVNIIHELEKAFIFLDDELLLQIDEPVSFNRFFIGDYWLYNTFSFTYYDDIKVWKYVPLPEPVAATVDIHPQTLNLRRKGKWITAYIELPEGYDVSQIDVSSIRLNETVPALSEPTGIEDYDGDGRPDLMVKFDRASVIALFAGRTVPENYVIEVSGTVAGARFKGTDTIRVISPPSKCKISKQPSLFFSSKLEK